MDAEMEESKNALHTSMEGVCVGGLYQGIDEVSSNVTLVKDDKKIVGERLNIAGRLSMQEYEALSCAGRS